jgi:putative acetyltransferase
MVTITTPTTEAELDDVRSLMRAFLAWHLARHAMDRHLIEGYFNAAAYEEELASLPGKYVEPDGALLLAIADGRSAGCVALRRVDDESCEMKRMFVYPEYHGLGIGRALAEAVIDRGRALGFRTMVLDTSLRQAEAQGLYRRLGFRTVSPYYELPQELRDWLVFMELKL